MASSGLLKSRVLLEKVISASFVATPTSFRDPFAFSSLGRDLGGATRRFPRERAFSKMAHGGERAKGVVPKDEVVRFISECMETVGTTKEDAKIVAHHLMTADYRGHFSHGLNRMDMYVNDIKTRITDPAARPEIITDFQAIALVDGKNALGQVVGKFSMELAIKKAKQFGIGMVCARGSNHYGICGYYSLMAIEEGLVGFSCTNTSPLMVPTRSKVAALGTNPLSLAMPAAEANDNVVLDMATTAVALGKIELAIKKGESLPDGWALGEDGQIERDPQIAFKQAKLMPLGGAQENSGYKGYGLALMVEMLCGILSGSNYGPNIRSWKAGTGVANLGQCFMAINPEAFAPGSKDRLSHLVQQLRGLPPTVEGESVRVAGDPEREAMKLVDQRGGICYHPEQLNCVYALAKELGVRPIELSDRKT